MNFYKQFEKYKLPVLENGVRLPNFKIEEKWVKKYNLKNDLDDYSFLVALCEEGLSHKIGNKNKRFQEYKTRMQEELSVFKELGFCSYLLITWDIVNYCFENGIPIGFGRGSAGNSLVLFLIGVTQIDSLKYNLYFERFLNKTRAKFKIIDGVKYYEGSLLMDVDLDIGASDRKRLIEWISQKYNGKIAKLPTSITFTTKTLIREVCKIFLEMSEEKSLEISEMIPMLYNVPKKIEEAYDENDNFKTFADNNPEAISIAKRLYELNKYSGVHASAWIITYDSIDETFPLKETSKGELCSVYTMNDASELAIKIDLLGLKCVTLIDKVCKKVNIDPYKIPINDKKVYEWLQKLENPKGLFQIEGDCNFRIAQQIKPKSLENLAAIVALARPGVLQFASVYAKYLETGEFQSVHPFFDDILKDTAGIPLYQESLLKMANKVGFTLSESETLRKIVGKKEVKKMGEWEDKVKKKVRDNKLEEKVGEILWKIMDDSKHYSFNAGHATAYGLMSYITAYLKFYYPQEFFLSLLELSNEEQNTTDEIQKIELELPNFNIKLLGPDLIKSGLGFQIEDKNIRFGLGYIKGIAKKSFEKLQEFKHEYPNKISLFNAAKESGLNIGVLSSLIMSGAMDAYIKEPRPRTVLDAQTWNILTDTEKVKAYKYADRFKYNVVELIRFLITNNDEKGKPFINEKRLNTIRKKRAPFLDIYRQNSKILELANYWYEKKLLGYSYSQNLFDILQKTYPELIPIHDALNIPANEYVTVCGEIRDVKQWKAKKTKNPTFKASISDGTGMIEAMLFGNNIELERLENKDEPFQKEWIVVVSGRKREGSTIFADKIRRQEHAIYMKLSDVN